MTNVLKTLHSVFLPNNECSPNITELERGKYFFELWGASGGGIGENYGKGAYACGIITLNKEINLSIYVGTKGGDPVKAATNVFGGCNGGGNGGMSGGAEFYSGAGGGGATDIRVYSYDLDSRIIVAGGGGGGCSNIPTHGVGGDAGKIVGYDSTGSCNISLGGGNDICLTKGQGQNGRDTSSTPWDGGEGGGGAGGGWYGGCTSKNIGQKSNSAGGGGSSYISGYPGLEANPNYLFSSYSIYDGRELFLSEKGIPERGHTGDGFVRISIITTIITSAKVIFMKKLIILFAFVSK